MDPNLGNIFNITCDIIESPVLLDCKESTVGVPSISEKTILIPYNVGLIDNTISFRLAYSYRLCGDNEVVTLSGNENKYNVTVSHTLRLNVSSVIICEK